ncbi:hypothetical protein NEISICOT_03468 [Neisseria sicca ATCC 29256]|uniref:Lipocalin-like domain-containing protein n=1 Tax=Neisseria sicca ATCC 29256 TaxID=547045 RepID=C6MA86_NEISI|nr:hypothetical protein [Neisseria sicca]EET42775.1 hypothetical protein NEISICOT_03468 [Neisseria sicca ATCC 29256]QMT37021.1 hypothetical protein H3L95_07630 [Neisseria sicca]
MQKKHLIFLLAAFAAAPVLAKPIVVQEAQLLGKWQCVANDKTPMTFIFGSGQKVSVIVDMNFPSPDDETLVYRNFADGTWTLDGGKIGLNIKITDVQRQHSTAKIRTILWRKVDKEMFAQMRNDIGKSDKSQMQVKKIGNDSLSVRMQGDRQDMACRKV